MNDDIVTRLRNALDDYTVERDSAPLYLWAEAADEIERLRKELAHARSEIARLERLAANG